MQFAAEKVIPVTLIPGDGIGPENVEATVMVLDALHAPFAWDVHPAREVGKRYECRLQIDERIVDACAMQLVLNRWQF